jgi:survival of motor neuron protein-interacting protein 1
MNGMRPLLYRADDDDDELDLQRPALPIGDCEVLDTDNSVPPADGLEYLRRVRREARELPAVIRKPAPRSAVVEDSPSSTLLRPLPRAKKRWIPDLSWEEEVVSDFDYLAGRLRRSVACSRVDTEVLACKPALPGPADSAAWEAFCLGSARTGAPGHPPLVSLVRRLEQRAALGVLQALHARLEGDAHMSPQLARWLYALLLRLERALPADGAATLRALLRTCAELRSRLGDAPGMTEAELVQSAAAINSILCIIGRYFGQASEAEMRDFADKVDL